MAPWRPWGQRTRGEPLSGNGASSFHLAWRIDETDPLVEVAAVLEVVVPPAIDRLYFWALQVSFLDGRVPLGAAHVGLQWNGNHPGHGAVNWGGYAEAGGLLPGSASPLPSAPDDPNTRDFPWEPGCPYRLRVGRVPGAPGWWRGEVTDLRSGRVTVVRDLQVGGDRISAPMVWSEVFARCEHPSVTARWSGLEGTTVAGGLVVPTSVSVSYEPHAAGGCDNTTVATDDIGLLQITATARTVAPGTVLPLP